MGLDLGQVAGKGNELGSTPRRTLPVLPRSPVARPCMHVTLPFVWTRLRRPIRWAEREAEALIRSVVCWCAPANGRGRGSSHEMPRAQIARWVSCSLPACPGIFRDGQN